jgi:hypothetical protein
MQNPGTVLIIDDEPAMREALEGPPLEMGQRIQVVM